MRRLAVLLIALALAGPAHADFMSMGSRPNARNVESLQLNNRARQACIQWVAGSSICSSASDLVLTGTPQPASLGAVDLGTATAPFGDLYLTDDTSPSHSLKITDLDNLTAARTLSLTLSDADRTLTISGNATVSQDYSTAGSPQFTGVNIGNASDTTITREGAGDILVEGNHVYRAGGTDVAVADGGTGASSLNDLIALTTHTTGNYVKDVADGTGIDGTASAEGATYTPSLDTTEITTNTWGAGNYTDMVFSGAGAIDLTFNFATSNTFVITQTDAGAAGPIYQCYHNSATPAASDVPCKFDLAGEDSAGNTQTYAQETVTIDDATSTSEDGTWRVGVVTAGTVADELRLTGAALSPEANDGLALGTTALGFSDGFFATGAVLNFANGEVTITETADALTVAGGGIVAAAGTTSIAPLQFTSGTSLTNAADGAIEFDGDVFYGTTDADNRGYIPVVNFVRTDGNRTLSNSGSEQALFTAANDTLTIETGTYRFEFIIALSTMSATSGNAAIDPLGAGTATVGSWQWGAWGQDTASITTVGTIGGTYTDSQQSAVNITSAGTGANMYVHGFGTFEVTGAGTMIPSITLTTAAAAVLQGGSYFMFERISGSTSLTSIGQWG
jgi:hypothetical protein